MVSFSLWVSDVHYKLRTRPGIHAYAAGGGEQPLGSMMHIISIKPHTVCRCFSSSGCSRRSGSDSEAAVSQLISQSLDQAWPETGIGHRYYHLTCLESSLRRIQPTLDFQREMGSQQREHCGSSSLCMESLGWPGQARLGPFLLVFFFFFFFSPAPSRNLNSF